VRTWASIAALAAVTATAAASGCSSGGSPSGDEQAGDRAGHDEQGSSTTDPGERPTTTRRPSTSAAPDRQDPGPTSPSTTNPQEGPVTSGWWHPTKGLTWQWQIDGGPIDQSVDAQVYDVDLFETPAATVKELHDRGRKVICYFSAGSWEPYRPDSGDFPDSLKGGVVDGWPDERWLDIRQRETMRPLLAARLDLCAEKGFDGVEPDWLDHHEQDTGFPITADDQLAFNRMLAGMAHDRGLAIGLKNDLGQVAQLADLYDFAVVEQCAEFDECHMLIPFLDRDKPVFHAEYDLPTSAFCAESRRLGLSSIRKRLGLDPWRETC
jgi:hypothetical protein